MQFKSAKKANFNSNSNSDRFTLQSYSHGKMKWKFLTHLKERDKHVIMKTPISAESHHYLSTNVRDKQSAVTCKRLDGNKARIDKMPVDFQHSIYDLFCDILFTVFAMMSTLVRWTSRRAMPCYRSLYTFPVYRSLFTLIMLQSCSCSFITADPQIPRNLTLTSLAASTATVTWEVPDSVHIHHFELVIRPLSVDQSIYVKQTTVRVEPDERSYLLHDLYPETEYFVIIRLVDQEQQASNYSEALQFCTTEGKYGGY